jgi:hypothetical protein
VKCQFVNNTCVVEDEAGNWSFCGSVEQGVAVRDRLGRRRDAGAGYY